MLGELTPCGGGPPIPLLQSKIVLGRHPKCDISLPFSTISSQHCELELREGSWCVRDLGSRNGIQVNGVSCESKRLTPGDILSFARHRYKILFTAQGEQPGTDMEDELFRFELSLLEKAGFTDLPPSSAGGKSARADKSLGELVPCGGGPAIPLLKSKLLVGRHPSCDLVLGFPSISSRHCELEIRDGFWFVRDLGSRNGIRVDGERCESERLLPQNVLSIANHRYRLSYMPSGDDESPQAESRAFGVSLLEKAGLIRGRSGPRARLEQTSAPEPDRPARRRDNDEPRQRWTIDEDS